MDLLREIAERETRGGGAGSVPQSPIGVLDAACLSYKCEGGSSRNQIPERISPNPKRRKKGEIEPEEYK